MRKQSRQLCFFLLFEYLFLGEQNDITLKNFIAENSLSGEDVAFIKKRVDGVVQNIDGLKQNIGLYSLGFSIERIYRVDLAILLLSCYELEFCRDIPPAVAISEAVELSKKFSTEKSGSFINGILASFYKKIYGNNASLT
jgi:N utilization substance protein B